MSNTSRAGNPSLSLRLKNYRCLFSQGLPGSTYGDLTPTLRNHSRTALATALRPAMRANVGRSPSLQEQLGHLILLNQQHLNGPSQDYAEQYCRRARIDRGYIAVAGHG